MSKPGAPPWSSGRAAVASLFGVAFLAAASRVIAVGAVARRHRVRPGRVESSLDGVEQRLAGLEVSLRSGCPPGEEYRSSPHQTDSRDQSMAVAREAIRRASCSVATPMPPPVSTIPASPRPAAWASTTTVMIRAATACASRVASRCTTMSGVLMSA